MKEMEKSISFFMLLLYLVNWGFNEIKYGKG